MDLDFGKVYLGQICRMPVKIKSSCLGDVSLSSSLQQVVYFKDEKQELNDLTGYEFDSDGYVECMVYFKPERLGP